MVSFHDDRLAPVDVDMGKIHYLSMKLAAARNDVHDVVEVSQSAI